MSTLSLKDYLAGPQMTKLFDSEAIKPGLPNTLPAALMTPGIEKPVGMEVTWEQITGNRESARYVHHLSPSRRREVPGVEKKTATAVGTKESFVIDQDRLMALKSDIPMIAEGARRRIVGDLANFRRYTDNLRTNVVASAFTRGGVWFNSSGEILTSSSGAAISVSFARTALTKTDAIIGSQTVGDWSSASTDIPAALRALKDASIQATGYEPVHCLYGRDIPSLFAKNTAMQAFLSRNPGLNQQFMDTNELPAGLLDYQWHPGWKMFHLSSAGTKTSWLAANQIVLIPEPSPEWYEFIEAGTLVPNGVASPNMDIEQLLTLSTIKNGRFSYTEMATDPMQARVIVGDYYLPVIKVPGVIYSVTVS